MIPNPEVAAALVVVITRVRGGELLIEAESSKLLPFPVGSCASFRIISASPASCLTSYRMPAFSMLLLGNLQCVDCGQVSSNGSE